jgi:DNA-binding GntR family transcriptional regulator
MYSGAEPPKYRQIMSVLKDQMSTGVLRPGDRLPTVREIAEKWNVSHATATKVARELCREGYAHVVGNATLVRERSSDLTVKRILWGARDRPSLGDAQVGYNEFGGPARMPGWCEVTASGLVPAPDYVADVMELERGSRVLRVERVDRWSPWPAAGERPDPVPAPRPYQLTVHWYPAAWAEISPSLLVTGKDDGTSPLTDNGYGAQLAEEATGRRPVAGLEAYHARLADEREARLLEVAIGSPVQGIVETWQDDDGVVEYRETVMPMGVTRMIQHRPLRESDPE